MLIPLSLSNQRPEDGGLEWNRARLAPDQLSSWHSPPTKFRTRFRCSVEYPPKLEEGELRVKDS
jgi:hypothetical protein